MFKRQIAEWKSLQKTISNIALVNCVMLATALAVALSPVPIFVSSVAWGVALTVGCVIALLGYLYSEVTRACLQFISDAYVPRLVRGIQEMVKLKQNQFNYSFN